MTWRFSNIFDPVHDELDRHVFRGITPRRSVVSFIEENLFETLNKALHFDASDLFHLYLTGSLTTYQYSETSDVDISLFVDWQAWPTPREPGELRRQLIAIMVDKLDGTFLPGTEHPLQHFVVAPGVNPSEMYKPGLRSAWSFDTQEWVVPPERERAHDIEADFPTLFLRARVMAEKMEQLLNYNPIYAREFWHQIHKKRQREQRAGKGDFSEGNIVYKYLAHAGYFDRIRTELGEFIAKTADEDGTPFGYDAAKDHSLKIIWRLEDDTILLGGDKEAAEDPPEGRVIGEYTEEDVILEKSTEWLNPSYFRKVWEHSFPDRPIRNIFINQDGEYVKVMA